MPIRHELSFVGSALSPVRGQAHRGYFVPLFLVTYAARAPNRLHSKPRAPVFVGPNAGLQSIRHFELLRSVQLAPRGNRDGQLKSVGIGILTGLFRSADTESNDKSLGITGGGPNAGLYPAPGDPGFPPNKNTPDLSGRGRYERMERETGLEPATLSLGS
jgi:hypothetical protein